MIHGAFLKTDKLFFFFFKVSDSLFVSEGELRDESPSFSVFWIAVSLQKKVLKYHKQAVFCLINNVFAVDM